MTIYSFSPIRSKKNNLLLISCSFKRYCFTEFAFTVAYILYYTRLFCMNKNVVRLIPNMSKSLVVYLRRRIYL